MHEWPIRFLQSNRNGNIRTIGNHEAVTPGQGKRIQNAVQKWHEDLLFLNHAHLALTG